MKLAGGIIVLTAFVAPALAMAQTSTPASASDERRLSAEQVEAILADAAAKRAASEKQIPADVANNEGNLPSPPRQVHGEVGFGIGTGGYREAFGTAIYPLGSDGVAAISLNFADWGRRRFPR